MIITSNGRSAVSEIFGFVLLNHQHQFNEQLDIGFEAIQKFDAVSPKIPLPQGWHAVIDAEPSRLLQRGFDKIIHVSRDLTQLCKAQALYHRGAKSKEDYINLILSEPSFFSNIQRKWDALNEDVSDSSLLRISLRDWNYHTLETFNEILDFLGYPQENRIVIVPIKKTRNWEGYSCSHLSKHAKVNRQLEMIRNE